MTPYYRLSGFYFFYFASIGAFIPYWSIYLKELSFSPLQIGELMAILMATKIVAPNIWGWIADHTGRRVRIIRIATFVSVVAFSGLLFARGYGWLALLMATFSFFWHAALPQFEATTMAHLGEGTHRYSRIRLWGSIGFILSVSLLAFVFDHYGVRLLPAVMLVLLVGIWLNALFVPGERQPAAHTQHLSLLGTLSRPVVLALLLSCFFLQASHGPYYTFFSIYLEEHGYARSVVGQLWALGVIAEVGVFLLMHRWLPAYGAGQLLFLAIVITAVRWLLIATLVDSLPVLLLAQVMHAASYGLYHASAIHLIHRLFPGRLQGRGQALYSSISFGLGGAAGSLASGYVWEQVGDSWTYILGSLLAAIGAVFAWIVKQKSAVYHDSG